MRLVLVATHGIFSCVIWDLVRDQGWILGPCIGNMES